MTSPLENLAGPGQPLRKEAPDAKEFAALRRSGLTRLADASKKRTLWRVDSTLPTTPPTHYASALRHAGFRPTNRYIVFQVLPHTLGVGPEVWRVLAKCHDVRNRAEYEGDLYVDKLPPI